MLDLFHYYAMRDLALVPCSLHHGWAVGYTTTRVYKYKEHEALMHGYN